MPSQFSFSSARLCRVQKLQFGILSPDEVVRDDSERDGWTLERSYCCNDEVRLFLVSF